MEQTGSKGSEIKKYQVIYLPISLDYLTQITSRLCFQNTKFIQMKTQFKKPPVLLFGLLQ